MYARRRLMLLSQLQWSPPKHQSMAGISISRTNSDRPPTKFSKDLPLNSIFYNKIPILKTSASGKIHTHLCIAILHRQIATTVMENSDDFECFPPLEAPSSPVPERKLKRLKKAKTLLHNSPKFETLDPDGSNTLDFEQEKLETLDFEKSIETLDSKKSTIQDVQEEEHETLDYEKSTSQDLEESNSGSHSGSESFEKENGLDSDADSLGIQEDVSGAKRTLDFDSVSEEYDGRRQDQFDVMEMEKDKESEDLKVEDLEKKRLHSDAFGNKKDKKKRVKTVDDDGKPKSAVFSKRTVKVILFLFLLIFFF